MRAKHVYFSQWKRGQGHTGARLPPGRYPPTAITLLHRTPPAPCARPRRSRASAVPQLCHSRASRPAHFRLHAPGGSGGAALRNASACAARSAARPAERRHLPLRTDGHRRAALPPPPPARSPLRAPAPGPHPPRSRAPPPRHRTAPTVTAPCPQQGVYRGAPHPRQAARTLAVT